MPDGDIGKRIAKAMSMAKPVPIRPADLARMIGVTPQRVNGWLRQGHDPPTELIGKISNSLGVTVGALLGTEPIKPTYVRLSPLRGVDMGKIRVVGIASAGRGVDSLRDEDSLEVPIDMARAEYSGMQVEGDSMLPLLHPYDTVVFKDHREPRPGLVFAVRRDDGGPILVKRLQFQAGHWQLLSINPAYGPQPLEEGDQVLGYLVGIVRIEGTKVTTIHQPEGLRD